MPTDQSFDSDGVEIAYDDVGEGEPIVLVHGFASSRTGNWNEPGWYDALTDAGRRVIALDCRGHGESGKPHDPEAYADGAMAQDVVRLLDHLGIDRADLMGYSMGGGITLRLLVEHPDRFNAVVPSGIGTAVRDRSDDDNPVGEAMEADDAEEADDPIGRDFREFAEARGNDIDALAAYQRAPRQPVDEDDLAEVSLPVLFVTGDEDELVGDPHPIAESVPGAEVELVPGGDHLTTVGDQHYKDVVLEFLDREGL